MGSISGYDLVGGRKPEPDGRAAGITGQSCTAGMGERYASTPPRSR
jgi:hypothetical protein